MATHSSAAMADGRGQPAAMADGRGLPLTFDIARLPHRPGSMLVISHTVPSPVRIGLDLVAIEAGTPLALDLRFESVSEGVLVTGTVSALTTGECVRCLTGTDGEVTVHIAELYAYPGSTTAATTEDDEVGHVVNETIDLQQPVIDAVGLEVPLSPLCRDDCPGLCPVCGVPLAEAQPGHGHDQIGPAES